MCTKDRDAVGARWSRAPTRHSAFAGALQPPVPTTAAAPGWPRGCARRRGVAASVVRVRPRVSKGITDLLGRPRSSGSAPALPRRAAAVVSLVDAMGQTVHTTN